MNRDSVNPGLQTAVTMKLPDPFEDLDEHVLENVRRLGGIVEKACDEVENRVLVDSQQVSEGIFGTRLQLRDQRRFFRGCGYPPIKRYADGPRGVHHAHTIALPGSDFNTALAFFNTIDTGNIEFVPENMSKGSSVKGEG
jgi:hypothetical protein